MCLTSVLIRRLSSSTAVLCALYGVGGDLAFLHCCFVCFVAHTQPHSSCPVPSVDLPCLTSNNRIEGVKFSGPMKSLAHLLTSWLSAPSGIVPGLTFNAFCWDA
eukprot:jgi/Chrzof1/14072/Cz08g24050.t1